MVSSWNRIDRSRIAPVPHRATTILPPNPVMTAMVLTKNVTGQHLTLQRRTQAAPGPTLLPTATTDPPHLILHPQEWE